MSASPFRTWLRCAAVVLCSPVFVAPLEARAQGQTSTDGRGVPTVVVKEGGIEQPLWIASDQVADFGKGTGGPLVRPAEAGDGSVTGRSGKSDADPGSLPAEVSPIFLDESGQPRALAGGVIVTLKEALPESQARAQLEAAGLVPRHQIGERMWLVDSPVGIQSLQLAERLNAGGGFESAQPNWWRPRRTK